MASTTTLIGLALIWGSLSACGKTSEGDPLMIEPRNEIGTKEDKFGKGFGSAIHADSNSEPREVQEGDLAPVSLTAEPVVID